MYALHARSILASINRDLSRNGWWRLRPDLVQKTKVDLVRFDDPRRDVLFPPVPRNFARRDLGSWLSSNRLMTRLHVFVVSPLFFFNVKEIRDMLGRKRKKEILRTTFGEGRIIGISSIRLIIDALYTSNKGEERILSIREAVIRLLTVEEKDQLRITVIGWKRNWDDRRFGILELISRCAAMI